MLTEIKVWCPNCKSEMKYSFEPPNEMSSIPNDNSYRAVTEISCPFCPAIFLSTVRVFVDLIGIKKKDNRNEK